MQIDYAQTPRIARFAAIDLGKCFCFRGEAYIKTVPCGTNAVKLSDGKLEKLLSRDFVSVPISARVVIEKEW